MKIDRLSGTTYLTYIRSQLSALNAGLAARMATRIHFVNVGATVRKYQKNGQRGTTILHTRTESWFCPVQALARRVASVMTYNVPASTPLSFVRPGVHVEAKNITALVRHAAIATNLVAQGYNMRRIGTHSLRASGAMALKLQGEADSTIMKIGRWSGNTYLTYIHSQIGALNAGLAARMATRVHFVNVGATVR
jgi:hypothetical protein